MSESNNYTKKPKAVVVGGSIAGVSCAHALIAAGWDVVVLEKTSAPPTGSPTGAGLGLDPLARKLIESWLGEQSHLLHKLTLPLSIDQVYFVLFLMYPCVLSYIYVVVTVVYCVILCQIFFLRNITLNKILF